VEVDLIQGLFVFQWLHNIEYSIKNNTPYDHPLVSTGMLFIVLPNTKKEKREIEYEENPLRLVARS
tara:strand:+ start:1664 stop:1861 length:198 start_codon:yes stop_codon:yes gene_type:complete